MPLIGLSRLEVLLFYKTRGCLCLNLIKPAQRIIQQSLAVLVLIHIKILFMAKDGEYLTTHKKKVPTLSAVRSVAQSDNQLLGNIHAIHN